MTMTTIHFQKASYIYGHGPLKLAPEREENDDHDEDTLKKDSLYIWSWSSENTFSEMQLSEAEKATSTVLEAKDVT